MSKLWIGLVIILILALGNSSCAVAVTAQTTDIQFDNGDCDPSLVPVADTVQARPLKYKIILDGVLNETDWQQPPEKRLVQNEPNNGCAPSNPTEFWVAYDDEALYLAARLSDSQPDSISARLGRRDTSPASDWVELYLDTFNDDRNAFMFSVNPAGVVGDAVIYNDGWNDSSWDGVWDVATAIDDQGWTLEMRIPFSQLKFPESDEQVWGINFVRFTLRNSERSMLFHQPRGGSENGSRFPDLVGIRDIEPQGRVELRPFVLGKIESREVDPDDPYHSDPEFSGNLGLDLKVPLSNNLTMNATVNPDFGQVEVDPAVVNLSAFETFYEDRRPFFVEDATVFQFGREGTNNNWNFNWMDPLLFYSRRVGRSPQLGVSGNHDFVDIPQFTSILGAVKVSGKIGNTSVGGMTAITAREKARLQTAGNETEQVVEPLTNYSVVRAKTTWDEGRKGMGFLVTHTARDLDDPLGQAKLDRRALTGGVDGWLNLDDDGVWALRGYLGGSHLSGSPEALSSLQTSSRHYFQRPDADHLKWDPEATKLDGWIGRVMLNKQSGNWSLNSSLGYSSPGYEVNDLGFMFNTDKINTHLVTGYRWLEPNLVFRKQSLNIGGYRTWDTGSTPTGGGVGAWYWAQLANYWNLNLQTFHNPPANNPNATRGGPMMRTTASHEYNLSMGTDYRKKWIVWANGSFSHDNANNRSASGSLSLELKPAANLSLEFGPKYSWRQDDAQYHDTIDDPLMPATYDRRYIFSDLEYRQFSFESRIDWTFTPNLTLQAYMQPLLAVGDYSRPKELARAGTREFNVYGQDNGSSVEYRPDLDPNRPWLVVPDGSNPGNSFQLADRDFNFKSLKVNLVLRWEYSPGGTFFLVWTQDRMNFDEPGRFNLGRNVRSLLDAPGEDIIMVKVSGYFSL